MKILVIGGGGREHALVWKLAQSPRVTEILCAPGNAGTAAKARNVDVQAGDLEGLLALATTERCEFTIVGPEQPLCAGIVDRFRAAGLRIFGPTKAAAQIEGSKAFAKQVLVRAKAPTAAHRTFAKFEDAKAYLSGEAAFPLVVKATGLAAGKGVVICKSREEATETARRFMVDREFGDASSTVVIEEFLSGEEVSLLCLTDGASLAPLPAAQDHKRALDGDEGPNTGGMGAYSPTPFLTEAMLRRVEEEILIPVVHEMKVMGAPFRGCLFAGLMLTRSGPRVLEFNARFGDPETQVVVPRLKGDLFELLTAVERGEIDALPPAALEIDPRPCVSVVLAAGMGIAAVPLQFFPVDWASTVGMLSATDPDVGNTHTFALVGGTQETHEVMTEKAIKINEKLCAKGKTMDSVSREEFDDIAASVGLHRHELRQG